MDVTDAHTFHEAADEPIPLAQLLGVEEGSPEHVYLYTAPVLHRIAVFTFHVPEEDAATLRSRCFQYVSREPDASFQV